jgi:SAM-dependent methyltransferase
MEKWFDDILLARGSASELTDVSYDDADHDVLFEVEDNSWWFKYRNKVIEAAIKLTPPPKNNEIIEIGGGNGNTTHYLSKCGYKTGMFEPGKRGCANAYKRGVENVVCAMFGNTTVKPNSVSSIGLFDVIEHIEDDAGFLASLNEFLVSGGYLYITVPAHMALWSSSDVGHYRRYNLKGLTNVLESAGYDIVFATYFFWFLPIPQFLFKMMKKERGKTDFVVPALIEKTLNFLLKAELQRIGSGKMVSFGSSIFVTAQKRQL